MNYRKLGNTGLMVSEIGLGTEYLYRQPKQTVISVIQEAIKNGINYYDLVFNETTYIRNLSDAFRNSREKLIVTCHLGTIEKDGKVQRSRNLKHCENAFLNTISILEMDSIDILNIQYVKEKEYESIITPGGMLDLAKKLKQEGKTKFIGLSTHNISVGLKATKSRYFDTIMIQINLVNHSLPRREEFLKNCANERIGLIAIKPFAKGNLLKKNRTVSIAKYHSGGISLKKKIPPYVTPTKCLNYVLSQVGVSTTIPGVKNVLELKEILHFLKASEDEKDFFKLIKDFGTIS